MQEEAYCGIAREVKETIILCISFSRQHAQMSIDIIRKLLPEDHLLLASSKRVKGIKLAYIYYHTQLNIPAIHHLYITCVTQTM